MRACRGLCGGGPAGLDGDDRLAGRHRLVGHGGKIRRIDNALDIEACRGDARVRQQAARHVGEACLRLVADAGDIGHGKPARLHAQIDRDV